MVSNEMDKQFDRRVAPTADHSQHYSPQMDLINNGITVVRNRMNVIISKRVVAGAFGTIVKNLSQVDRHMHAHEAGRGEQIICSHF